MADEVKQRDFCTDEFMENEKQAMVKQNEIKDLSALIETQKNTISSLTDDIKNLNAEIDEMKVQMKKASEDREGENHEFQQTVMDQRATQRRRRRSGTRAWVSTRTTR